MGNYIVYDVQAGVYNFEVNKLPEKVFPEPINKPENLGLIGRMNASSMFIADEKLPGFEAFKANDLNDSTAWKANGAINEWLEVEWVKPQTFNQIIIKESGNNIANYKIQYLKDNKWIELVSDAGIGAKKEHGFETVTASKCRLFISTASNKPMIAEIEVLNK